MGILAGHRHSFEADITILPLGPDTRRTHPLNVIRWDFCRVEDLDERGRAHEVSMVWPEFVDKSGAAIPADVPLQGRLHALVHVLVPEMVEHHLQRFRVGLKVRLH